MVLSRYTLKNINSEFVRVPDEGLFELPEKVLQFGTGALLRGLADYFIDQANRRGVFNGRVVVVRSTAQDVSVFDRQDGLYTVCVRGVVDGQKVEHSVINASISRVLSASGQWEQVLECAHNQQLQIIISNTTEVGIQLVNDDVRHHPPGSFPGKLLAFLYERFRAFGGSELSGMVIIPTELIPDNGKKLESIVLELAHLNGLEEEFIEWIEKHNCFCNSLVDRIVPGRPQKEELLMEMEGRLGYSDKLLTVAEPYSLWAIEGGEAVKKVLSFAQADESVLIEQDINLYRELKLRLLNGTHTLSCGLAFLSGCPTVKQAMDEEHLSAYITALMQEEIAPCIPYPVSPGAARQFAARVLERFSNPHIHHSWLNITVQYSSKMKLRCIAVLLKHYEQKGTVPPLFALGFAAYLYFTRPVVKKAGQFYGELQGQRYPIHDDRAEVFYQRWAKLQVPALVQEVLKDPFWEEDLSELPGLEQAVTQNLNQLITTGVKKTIGSLPVKKAAVV